MAVEGSGNSEDASDGATTEFANIELNSSQKTDGQKIAYNKLTMDQPFHGLNYGSSFNGPVFPFFFYYQYYIVL